MGKREETRRFWTDVVSRYERADQPRKVFAANHKVGLAALQYWICKLRREAAGAKRQSASSELRLVPVRVAPQTTAHAGRVEIRIGGLSIRAPLGTDPRYLASVVAATRAAAC